MRKKLLVIMGVIMLVSLSFQFVSNQAALGMQENTSTNSVSFYVSPNGDDNNPGSISQPFRTLVRARDTIRDIKATTGIPDGGIVVWLRGGVYELNTTQYFFEEDSGAAGKPIKYCAYPGEEVRIIGGKRLQPSWFQPVTNESPVWNRLDEKARGNVFQVNLKENQITDFGSISPRGFDIEYAPTGMELFFNKDKMQLSRWPDTGEEADGIKDGFALVKATNGSSTISYEGNRPERWSNAKDIWLHGYWKYLWADMYSKVLSIDTGTNTMTVEDSAWFSKEPGMPYYALNLLEEITLPGEWYLDRETGILYFWPPSPLEESELYVSMLDTLLQMNDVQYVSFQNIVFEYCRSHMIIVNNGSYNSFEGCTMRNGGTSGVTISGYGNVLNRCNIYNLGEFGVKMSGGDRILLKRADNYITNCDIYNFSQLKWTYAPGIFLYGIGQTVAHNRIHNAPHTAIWYNGNDMNIEYNEIYDVCSKTSDAGVIYSGRDWSYRGNRIINNFIHNISSCFIENGIGTDTFGVHGVYLDDCLSGVEVRGNIFYEISGAAVVNGGGRDNMIDGNIMVGCKWAFYADNRGAVWINNTPGSDINLLERMRNAGINYKEEPWKSAYPELFLLPDSWEELSNPGYHWLYPENCSFIRNIGYRNNVWMEESDWNGNGVFDKFRAISNNIENSDPFFVDEGSLNLDFKPESPVYSIEGFQEIPFNQIGIQ